MHLNPVAFYVFGREIRWYGILITLGVIVALIISSYNSKLKNVDFDKILDVFLIAFPLAIVGARLYYVAFEFENYRGDLMSIINIREGGLAIHGGLIFGIGTAWIYTKIKKLDLVAMLDVVAPGIILAQAIGRWGNFFNSEAHGGEVSAEFISKFPAFIQKGMFIEGAYYHPTFLYESLWNLLVFAILMFVLIKRRENEKGLVISLYAVLYSLGRFFIEGLRTDSLLIGGLRIAQIVSLIGIVLGLIIIIYLKLRKKKNIFS